MMICLRCGQTLPEGCYPTRKFCDECQRESNRERARKRLREGRERWKEEQKEKQESNDKAYCKPCFYCGVGEYSANLCDYILITGHRRSCKCGVGCTKRILKEAESDANELY